MIKRIAEWKVTTDEWRGERQMLRVGVEARSELQHRVLRSEISGHAVRGTSQATWHRQSAGSNATEFGVAAVKSQ